MKKYIIGIVGSAALIVLCAALVGTVKSNLERRLAAKAQTVIVSEDDSNISEDLETDFGSSSKEESKENGFQSSENKKKPADRQENTQTLIGEEKSETKAQPQEKPVNTAARVIKVPDYYDSLKKHGIDPSQIYWCNGHWYYTVQKSDTLKKLSQAFNTNPDEISKANSGVNDDTLAQRKTIVIPD